MCVPPLRVDNSGHQWVDHAPSIILRHKLDMIKVVVMLPTEPGRCIFVQMVWSSLLYTCVHALMAHGPVLDAGCNPQSIDAAIYYANVFCGRASPHVGELRHLARALC